MRFQDEQEKRSDNFLLLPFVRVSYNANKCEKLQENRIQYYD